MDDHARRIGLNILATLPVWLAVGAVLLLARDLSEIASAAIAAALVISLAGVVAIAVVVRRSAAASEQHDVVVQQSLALVECMKEINRRVMHIEAIRTPAPPAAVQVTSDMGMPDAGNDRAPPEAGESPAGPKGCEQAPAPPEAASHKADTPPAAPPPVPAVVSLLVGRRDLVVVAPGDGSETAMRQAMATAAQQAAAGRGIVELILPHGAGAPDLATALANLSASDPTELRHLLVGIEQGALLAADGACARMIGELCRRGARLSLRNVSDRLIAAQTLSISNVGRVHIKGGWLLLEMARQPQTTAGWLRELASAGIGVVAADVETAEVARALAAMGVELSSGPAAILPDEPATRRPMPWVGRSLRA